MVHGGSSLTLCYTPLSISPFSQSIYRQNMTDDLDRSRMILSRDTETGNVSGKQLIHLNCFFLWSFNLKIYEPIAGNASADVLQTFGLILCKHLWNKSHRSRSVKKVRGSVKEAK